MGIRSRNERTASDAEQAFRRRASGRARAVSRLATRLVSGLTAVVLAGAVLVVTAASPASAATSVTVQEVPGTELLHDVACSTPTTCVAVGYAGSPQFGGVVVPITNGVPGPVQNIQTPGGFEGVACASATTCYGVGGGQVMVITNGVAGASQPVPGGGISLTEIFCPSSTTCVAVGNNKVVLITNGVPGPAQAVDGLTIDDALHDVACTSATTCYAVGQKVGEFPFSAGILVPITNGVPGGFQPVVGSEILWSVDCASATTCYAAGNGDIFAGFFGSVLVPIVDGTAGALQSLPFPGPYPALDVACGSATDCVVVGFESTGSLVPIVNGIPGDTVTVPEAGGFYGADCVSASTCYAVGIDPTFPYAGVIGTITTTFDETSLTCTPGTSGSGAPIHICTMSDPNGIRTVQVYNSAANQKQTALAFNCSSAPTSVEIRLPAATRYKVAVTDCTTPRVKSNFVIRPNGSVNQI